MKQKLILFLICVICLSSLASATIYLNTHPNGVEGTSSIDFQFGNKVRINQTGTIAYITTQAGNTAPILNVYSTSVALLTTGNCASNNCTGFNSTQVVSGTDYFVMSGNGLSGTYTRTYDDTLTGSFPYVGPTLNFTAKAYLEGPGYASFGLGYAGWNNIGVIAMDIADAPPPDTSTPSFSNNLTNDTNIYVGESVRFNITITDANAGSYKYFWNWSGTFINETSSSYTTAVPVSTTKSINVSMAHKNICWGYWANDTLGNTNTSSLSCFDVLNTAPSFTIYINATDHPLNRTTANLTVYNTSSDSDNDFLSLSSMWYENGVSMPILYMPFSINQNALNKTRDYSSYGNNGTVYGAVWNSTGGLNSSGAYQFDGVNDYINVGTSSTMNSTAYTFSSWFKTSATSPDTTMGHRIITIQRSSATLTRIALMLRNNKPELLWVNPALVAKELSTNTIANDNVWHYFAATINGTNFTVYLDGIQKNSTTDTLSNIYFGVAIGSRSDAGFFNGTIDDVMIFNRSLSSNEISTIYHSGINGHPNSILDSSATTKGNVYSALTIASDGINETLAYSNNITIQNTAPTVTLTSPSDNDHNRVNLSVDFTPGDVDSDMVSCYLNVNGSVTSITNGSVTLGTSTVLTTIDMTTDGVYSWNVTCNDSSSSTSSSQRNYILDTINPILTIYSPINTTYYGFDFWINFSGADDNLYIINYTLYNFTGNILRSNQSLTTTLSYLSLNNSININGLQDGKYYINFSISDLHTGEVISELTKGKKGEDSFFVNEGNIDYNMSIYFVEKDSKLTDTPLTIKNYIEFNEEKTKLLFGFNVTIIKPETEFIFSINTRNVNIQLIESKYRGHMIWYPYGTDFEGKLYVNGNDAEYRVETKLISNNNAEARIIPTVKLSGGDIVEFKSESIFGLNIVERQYEIYIDALGTPSWIGNLTNASSTHPKYNETIQLNVNLSDRVGLNSYIFSWNGTTEGWKNDSLVVISGTSYNLSLTKTTNLTYPNVISWIVYFNDSNGNRNQTDIFTFSTISTPPVVSNILWKTVGGITSGTLSYGQTIDEINATCTESIDNDLIGCNITVTDPYGTIHINNQAMGNISSTFNYSQDFSLTTIGTWTISVTGYDGSGTTTTSTTITVGITTPTIFDGLYAYDYQRLLTTSEIDSELALYDYDTIGMTLNWSNFNTTFGSFKLIVNYTKENYNTKTFLTLNFDTGSYNPANSTFSNTTCSQINNNLTALKLAPYDEAIQFILFNVNSTDTYTVNFSNKIAECIVNATANKFAVYVNYSSASLNSNWVSGYTLVNITATDNTSYINKELNIMRTATSLTRIYFSLTSALQNVVELFHDTIITKIRGTPTITSLGNKTLAEISNGDIIIFNNLSTSTNLLYNVSGGTRAGKDVWDSTNKRFIEKDNDGFINVNISAYSFLNLYFADIDHLTFTDVWSASTTANQVYGWNRTGREVQGTYSIVGANDAMFYAYDPSYGHTNQFMIHYEWINTSYVTNYSIYCNNGAVIIADQSLSGINQIGCNSTTFGYISVADYADTDVWETNKKNNISVWIDTYKIGIFLDGLDTAVTGNNFATRFRSLANYIMVEKNKSCITNDYTSYSTAGVGGICDKDMKESFCARWNGTVGTPFYYWEDFNVDLARAEWARTNGNPQLAMTFGDKDDYDKSAYCYAEFLVLYGTTNGNLYKYGQPNFQGQQEIFTMNAGTQLENTWTKVNDSYYSRKYSNGIVWFNPLNYTWNIENDRQINNLTLSVKAQIYTGAPAQSTPIAIKVNEQTIPSITYDEIGAVQWASNTVNRNISSLYNQSGRYVIRLYSETPANPAGLNLYNSKANSTGVYSFWENSVNNPPEIGGTWTAYGRSGVNDDLETTNWMINLDLNDTTKMQIDNGITDITQTNQSYQRRTNLTISSTKSYDIEVWGEPITVSSYVNLSYWNGTVYKGLTPSNTSTCDSLDPSWGSTTIDNVTHKSCIELSGNNTIVRVVVPSLSSKTYSILGDDVYLPWFSNNQTNATATAPEFRGVVQLNITINDDTGIDYYRLTTLNDYGYPSNESAVNGLGQTSIIVVWNYTIIGIKNGTLQYQFWANDTSGNSNVSAVYSIEVHDIIAPAYFNFTNNASTKAKYGGIVNFSVNITDYNYGAGTGYFEFANNKTGVMKNVSITDAEFVYETLNVYGFSTIASYGLRVNLTRGNNICGQFWMKDYAGNVNQTLLTDSGACFTVANTAPSQPSISYPVNNTEYTTVTQIKFNSTDTDNDSITYYVFINDTLNITTTTNISSWNASYGYYRLKVIASDSYDNSTNSTDVYFTIASTPIATETASDGGVTGGVTNNPSGGCWAFAYNEKTCYYLSGGGECIRGCPNSLICNKAYDFNTVNARTGITFCKGESVDVTPLSNDTVIIQSKKIENKLTYLPQPLRSDTSRLLSYLYLRFIKAPTDKYLNGSWIVALLIIGFMMTGVYYGTSSFLKYRKHKRLQKN